MVFARCLLVLELTFPLLWDEAMVSRLPHVAQTQAGEPGAVGCLLLKFTNGLAAHFPLLKKQLEAWQLPWVQTAARCMPSTARLRLSLRSALTPSKSCEAFAPVK